MFFVGHKLAATHSKVLGYMGTQHACRSTQVRHKAKSPGLPGEGQVTGVNGRTRLFLKSVLDAFLWQPPER